MSARLILAAGLSILALLPTTAIAQSASAPSAQATLEAGAPIDPQALATAREIIRYGFPEDKRMDMFFGAVDALTSQMRSATMAKLNNDPSAKALVDAKIDKFISSGKGVLAEYIPAFMDAYAQGYAREFSQPELDAILAFAKSPAGGHFLLRSSAILSDPAFSVVNQDYMRKIQPLVETMRQELTQELVDHFTRNPPRPSGHS